MKNVLRRRAVWIPLAVLLLAFGGWRLQRRRAAKAAQPEGGATTGKATRGSLELRFSDTGDVAAKDSVDVASKVSGRVIELAVQEGSRVSSGQKLAVIQPGRSETEKYLPSSVLAPITGTVMRFVRDNGNSSSSDFAKVGDYVTGLFDSNSPTYLLTVADLRRMLVRMRISEMDVLKLKEGMPVTVSVDALPAARFTGRVSLISPQAERDNSGLKVFRVEVALDVQDARLRPGMTSRVETLLEKRENALKIPLAALFEEAGETFAYLQTPKKPLKTPVKPGLRTETDVEVLEGLKEGDVVLTEKPKEADDSPEVGRKGARLLRRSGGG
ncbi:MAG: efflux RND transporter periplasmic adaptor subunit [Elusimicrobiota bacterium]|jgi:multidrug efflux pump subunit AcrA (membrane-fusion protein)